MCTSCGSKPARASTAAISTWLLTPCSRSTATAGRAPAAMYGAATSCCGSKLSCQRRPGAAPSTAAASSSSAQSGSSRSRRMRHEVSDQARRSSAQGSSSNSAPTAKRSRGSASGRPTTRLHVLQAVRGQFLPDFVQLLGRHLQHDAAFLAEQLRQRRSARRIERDLEAAVAGEGHLRQRHEQSAVGAIVVGQHQRALAQRRERRGEAAQQVGIVEVGGRAALQRRRPAPVPRRRAGCGSRRSR